MYRPSIARLALASLLHAVGSLGLTPLERSDAPRPTGWRNPFRAVVSAGGMPHQSARECARRRGGDDWLAERNTSRARRGLASLPR